MCLLLGLVGRVGLPPTSVCLFGVCARPSEWAGNGLGRTGGATVKVLTLKCQGFDTPTGPARLSANPTPAPAAVSRQRGQRRQPRGVPPLARGWRRSVGPGRGAKAAQPRPKSLNVACFCQQSDNVDYVNQLSAANTRLKRFDHERLKVLDFSTIDKGQVRFAAVFSIAEKCGWVQSDRDRVRGYRLTLFDSRATLHFPPSQVER